MEAKEAPWMFFFTFLFFIFQKVPLVKNQADR